jgi:hypothetical protein
MPNYQGSIEMVYIDSASETLVDAQEGFAYVIDTAVHAVTIVLPSGIEPGEVVTIWNAPAGGLQLGGTNPGHNVTVQTMSPEEFDDGTFSQVLSAPTSMITAAARTYFPTGSDSQAGFNGWCH